MKNETVVHYLLEFNEMIYIIINKNEVEPMQKKKHYWDVSFSFILSFIFVAVVVESIEQKNCFELHIGIFESLCINMKSADEQKREKKN